MGPNGLTDERKLIKIQRGGGHRPVCKAVKAEIIRLSALQFWGSLLKQTWYYLTLHSEAPSLLVFEFKWY
jgi:hypothetical protein